MREGRSKRSSLLGLAICWSSVAMLACSEPDDERQQNCRPGRTIECYCMDGRRGSQRCFLDGSQYGPCQCSGDPVDDAGCVGAGCSDGRADDRDRSDLVSDRGCTGAGCDDDSGLDDRGETTDTGGLDTGVDRSEPDRGSGDTDSDDTGRDTVGPDIGPGSRLLGEDCDRASHCASDICLGLNMGAGFHSVCAAPCCHENECLFGFGCLQAGAGRYCLPSRIFPEGYTFTGATGASCGLTGNACKSGLCDSGRDECLGSCCTDAECVAFPCHWSSTGTTLRTFCDRAGLLWDYPHGWSCTDGMECHSGVCAQISPGVGQCAALCCTSSACPEGTGCGLVGGFGGAVVRACVPLTTGDQPNGAVCSDNGESCTSGHCVENSCRQLCCTDDNCVSPERCLPRETSEGILAPVCTPPDG